MRSVDKNAKYFLLMTHISTFEDAISKILIDIWNFFSQLYDFMMNILTLTIRTILCEGKIRYIISL